MPFVVACHGVSCCLRVFIVMSGWRGGDAFLFLYRYKSFIMVDEYSYIVNMMITE